MMVIEQSSTVSATESGPGVTDIPSPSISGPGTQGTPVSLGPEKIRPLKFRLRFSERQLLLGIGDLTLFSLALLTYLLVREDAAFNAANLASHWYWFATLVISWLIAVVITDGWNLDKAVSFARSQWAAGATVLLASMIFYCLPMLTPGLPLHRSHFMIMPGVAVLLISIWRLVVARTFAVAGILHRSLVVGAGGAGSTLVRELSDLCGRSDPLSCFAGHWLVGFVDDDPAKQQKFMMGVPVWGTSVDLVRLVEQFDVDEIIVAITHSQTIQPRLFQAILSCREKGVQVSTMTSFLESLTGRVPVEHAGSNLGVVMPVNSSMAPQLFAVVKRLIDLLAGVIGCLLTVAAAPLIWVVNQFTAPGPLFYTQQRVGHRGAVFNIVKFRSMVVDAEAHTGGAVWSSANDVRITPAGRFLRRTRIDELPQFWNVLRGHMSLVGPRPERPEFVSWLAQSIPFYRVRHAMKPGITGWAQVRYQYGASEEDSLKKLQYDLYYIKHQGVFLEWHILLRTVMVVLGFRGR